MKRGRAGKGAVTSRHVPTCDIISTPTSIDTGAVAVTGILPSVGWGTQRGREGHATVPEKR